MKTRFALAGMMAVSLSFLSGCAGDYYSKQRETVGTLTGGALGGFVGSQIGSGTGQLAATAAGVLAGALIGGSVGRSMDELDRTKAHQALETSRTGYATNWRNPDSGVEYSMTPTRTYQTASGDCRDYTTEAVIGGKRQAVRGTACRQPDGSWQTVKD